MGTRAGIDEMGLTASVDGIKWKDATNEPILAARPGYFDAKVVEPGPTPIIGKDAIHQIYNGGMPYEVGGKIYKDYKYQAGLAVYSKEDPTQ